MPRKTDTRSRILELAQPLLQGRGFNGFSYRHLATALGIKTAAVHYHFPKKTDLGVEVIDGMRRRFQRWAASMDASGADFWQRLDGYFAIHRKYVESNAACPAGILGAEFDAIPEAMRDAARALAAEVHGWLARTLQQGLDSGQCEFRGDPDDQAAVVSAAVQGALLIARACGKRTFDSTIDQLKKQMVPRA